MLSKAGDILTINGTAYDFRVIPDGATLPASAVVCNYITGNIERVGGILHINIILPTTESATQAANFPAPIINPADGALVLPA